MKCRIFEINGCLHAEMNRNSELEAQEPSKLARQQRRGRAGPGGKMVNFSKGFAPASDEITAGAIAENFFGAAGLGFQLTGFVFASSCRRCKRLGCCGGFAAVTARKDLPGKNVFRTDSEEMTGF
jgi:hypothetical protein